MEEGLCSPKTFSILLIELHNNSENNTAPIEKTTNKEFMTFTGSFRVIGTSEKEK